MKRSYASAATTKLTRTESSRLAAADAEAVRSDLPVELQREVQVGRQGSRERGDAAGRERVLDAASEDDAAVELGEQVASGCVTGRRADRAEPPVEGELDPDLVAPDRSGGCHPLALGERVGGFGTPAKRCELLRHVGAERVPALDELRLRRGCRGRRRGPGQRQ